MTRVLAFFGADLGHAPSSYLFDRVADGYILLPLDPSALAMVKHAGLGFTLLDDWVGGESRLDARRMGEIWDRAWFKSAREHFVVDGICWPELDRHAMSWFWSEVAYGTKLAEAFRQQGVRRLLTFRRGRPMPSVHYEPADTFSALLEARAGDTTAVEIRLPPFAPKAFARRILGRVWRSVSGQNRETRSSRNPEGIVRIPAGSIVFALNGGELDRFAPVINDLAAAMPGKLAAVVLNSDMRSLEAAADILSVPVTSLPNDGAAPADVAERFYAALQRVRDAAAEADFAWALNTLPFQFDHFATVRWPALVASYRGWLELWRVTAPRRVIVSSLYDAESQLPARAAAALGIPSFSIPHGGFQLLDDLISADIVLCGFELQKRLWESAGISAERLVRCRGVVPFNEYVSQSYLPENASNRLNVLVLVDPIAPWRQRVLPRVSMAAQLEALATLAAVPTDLKAGVCLRIKTHPGFPERELFEYCVPELAREVLAADASLEAALSSADLVVGVNYIGSALLHAHRARKPVIHLWLDPLVGETGVASHAAIMSEGGVVVSRKADFWDEIARLVREPGKLEALTSKSGAYAARYLDDSMYPDLKECLTATANVDTLSLETA